MTVRIASRGRCFISPQIFTNELCCAKPMSFEGIVSSVLNLCFLVAFPHEFRDRSRIVAQESAKLQIRAVKLMFHMVKSLLHAVQSRFDGCEIIAVAARLREDVARRALCDLRFL